MAEFDLDGLDVSFSVPDRPKVRDLVAYWSIVKRPDEASLFERSWEAAKVLIENWECEYMPLDTDLSEADDPRMATVVETVGMAVFIHVKEREKEAVPKN